MMVLKCSRLLAATLQGLSPFERTKFNIEHTICHVTTGTESLVHSSPPTPSGPRTVGSTGWLVCRS